MSLTPEDLIALEQKYSGHQIERNIAWPVVSERDPRSQEEIDRGGHDGHRMQPRGDKGRNYAGAYAARLAPLMDRRFTLLELGILRGIGLAVWCDLFPRARVIGLDVDPAHFEGHVETLKQRGAFTLNEPEIYQYDELADGNQARLAEILDGDQIMVCIDDALHIERVILYAMRDLMPFMAKRFLYFVEDNWKVAPKIRAKYPNLRVKSYDELTVIANARG